MTNRLCPVCGEAMTKTELDIWRIGDVCKPCNLTIRCSFKTYADRLDAELETVTQANAYNLDINKMLAARVAELEKENKQLRLPPDDYEKMCFMQSSKTNDELRAEIKRLEDALETSYAAIDSVGKGYNELTARVAELEKNNETLAADNSALEKIIFKRETLAAELAAEKEENRKLRIAIGIMEMRRESEIEDAKEEIERLKEVISMLPDQWKNFIYARTEFPKGADDGH
jgi:DNA repair exonuclease SbcCD ATPase subunit